MPYTSCCNVISSETPRSGMLGPTKSQQYLSLTDVQPGGVIQIGTQFEAIEFTNIFAQNGNDIKIDIPSNQITLAPNKSYLISLFLNTRSLLGTNQQVNAYISLDGTQYTPIAANTGNLEISLNIITTLTTSNQSSTISLLASVTEITPNSRVSILNYALNIIELD